jgi:hypothetical protein
MNMDMIVGGGKRKEFIDAGTLKEIEAAALAAAKKEDEEDDGKENPTNN